MNFSKLEKIMTENGVNSLAEIARALSTTPQAVSNWKARDQVPHRIAAKLNKFSPQTFEMHVAEVQDLNLSLLTRVLNVHASLEF